MNLQAAKRLFEHHFSREVHADSFVHRTVVMRAGDGVQFHAGPRARLPESGV